MVMEQVGLRIQVFSLNVDFVDSSGTDLGVRLADVNGDGLIDILKAPTGPNHYVYINDGDGTGWTEDSNYVLNSNFISSTGEDLGVRIFDVNGDSLPDIVVSKEGSTAIVYINDGDGTGWTQDSNYSVPVGFVSSISTDVGCAYS